MYMYILHQSYRFYESKLLTVLTASCLQKNVQPYKIPGKLVFIVEMLYREGTKRQRDIYEDRSQTGMLAIPSLFSSYSSLSGSCKKLPNLNIQESVGL